MQTSLIILFLITLLFLKKQDDIQKTLSNLPSQISDRFENFEDNLINYNYQLSNQTKNAYLDMKENVESFINDLKTKTKEINSDIVLQDKGLNSNTKKEYPLSLYLLPLKLIHVS